jgi:glycosyltransferase involved in cell wall biosynthesis
MDMRDGWLDEPLRPELSTGSIRARIEQRFESRVVHAAAAIIVTSPEWKLALVERYPSCAAKVEVVRNATSGELTNVALGNRAGRRAWVYAGRFGGSRAERNPCMLLQQLRHEAVDAGVPIDFRFVGGLSPDDVRMLREFEACVSPTGSTVTLVGHVPHSDAISEVNRADALLLLCASQHALPSKLFEYAVTGKPILAVCHAGSATWNACLGIKQAMRVDPSERSVSSRFYEFAEHPPETWVDAELQVEDARRRLLAVFRKAVPTHKPSSLTFR